jgi:hypothetical protein
MRLFGRQHWLAAVILFAPVIFSGCSEGPFSGIGAWTPWVRQKWAAEEQYVQTLYGRRDRLRNLASRANSMSPAEQERVSQELAKLFREDPIMLLRIEVVKTLVAFPTQTASDVLRDATRDKEVDVRREACRAWASRQSPQGIAALQEVVGGDTDFDVRLEAARSLGAYRDPLAVKALAVALNDPDPAMQFRVMQSLQTASGEKLGPDIIAWREYLRVANGPDDATRAAESRGVDRNDIPHGRN